MARVSKLQVGEIFHTWELVEKLSVTRQGTRYKLVCQSCKTSREALAKNIYSVGKCACSTPKVKSTRILLMVNGTPHTVKECAKMVDSENPQKAEKGIRHRLFQRSQGKPLTDTQVVFGITSTGWDDQPIERGLPKSISLWIREAVEAAIPMIEDSLLRRMSSYLITESRKSRKVTDTQDLQTFSRGLRDMDNETFIKATSRDIQQGESLPPSRPPEPLESPKPKADRLQEAKDWLKANNITDISYTWNTGETEIVSDLLVNYTEGNPNPNYQFQYEGILREIEADQQGRAQAHDKASAPVQVKEPEEMVVNEGSAPIAHYLKDPTHRAKLPAYDKELYPNLSEQERSDYEDRPLMETFCKRDVFKLKSCIVDRTLTSMDDFNFLLYNPEISTEIQCWNNSKVALYHDKLLFDLAFRCFAQVKCHRSFNRAMELWFMGRLMQHHDVLRENPSLIYDIVERCGELGICALDLSDTLDDPFNWVDRMEMGENKNYKLISETINEQVALEHTAYSYRLSFWREAGENRIRFEDVLWPEGVHLHDKDKDYIKDILSVVVLYGRNKAHWPEKWAKAELRYPEFIPVELFNDPKRDIEYAVYDDAPLPNSGFYLKLV